MEIGKVPHITLEDESVLYELFTNPMKMDQKTMKIEVEINSVTRIFSRHINPKEMCEPYENPAGGFVESTAYATEDAYVSPLVAVLENARVLGGAVLMGPRIIRGNEIICGAPKPIWWT